MVALDGFTTGTINDTIPTEKIGILIPPAEATRIYEQLGWTVSAKGAKSYVFPRLDAGPAAVGTITENDEIAAEDFTTSSESITRSCVGKRAVDSDANVLEGTTMSQEVKAAAIANQLRNRVDKDMLALFGGAANSGNHTGVNLDLDIFDAEVALFRAQYPMGPRFAFVGSINQVRDLQIAIRDLGNGGLIVGAGLNLFGGRMRMGFKGEWGGFEIYEGNTTQADNANDSGAFLSCAPLGQTLGAGEDMQWQPFSALGLAVWRPIRVVPQRIENRDATDLVGTIHYGTGITHDANIRELITKKAAA